MDMMLDYGFQPSASLFLSIGAFSGVVAGAVTMPLDTVRRRIQLDMVKSGETIIRNPFSALTHIIRNEGPASLYRGIFPQMLKVAPAVAVSTTLRDYVLGRFELFHDTEPWEIGGAKEDHPRG